MLHSLTLSNFLGFRFQSKFLFKRFNLITGLNNSGKSNLCYAIITLFLSRYSLCSQRKLLVQDFQTLLNDVHRPLDLTLQSHLSISRFLGHSNFNEISQQDWSGLLHSRLHLGLFQANPTSEHDIVIAEHPDSGIHPNLQHSIIRDLFSDPDIPGQWFIETHSQHVFNAFRILIKRGIIDSKHLNLLHLTPAPVYISVDSDGGIQDWPEYFFDQDDKDYEELFGL